MKKVFLIVLFLLMSILPISLHASIDFDSSVTVAAGGKYQVTERTNYDDLGYGITYIRDISKSSTTNTLTPHEEMDPQVVNVLQVASSDIVRVVNWSYASRTNWTKQTVTNLAKDFERNNPGWIVLAGVNGDFFDINGKGALPYQTTSACVCNGEVVRAIGNSTVSHQQIGFTNDGSKDSVIGGKKFETNSYHTLAIYENGSIVKEYPIDKLNEEPTGNEISLYFAYTNLVEETVGESTVTNRVVVQANVPDTNSYLVTFADRCYASNSSRIYGRGKINSVNKAETLNMGQFAIVTANEEVKSHLGENVEIRVQQDVIGDYAKCDNITGGGVTLVDNGNEPENLAEITDYRHPRTMVGQKEDGSIMLFTVDGRQEAKGMYGMSYEEMTAAMMYYGCTEGYNLDGGGSTTIILRNEFGGFDIKNSPSDGSERNDSNAIFVVTPGVNFNIQEATDNSVSFYYNSSVKDMTIKNVKATITGGNYKETKDVTTADFTWTGLDKNTEYELSCTYDIEYNGSVVHGTSSKLSFKTGNQRPIVNYATFEKVDNVYKLEYDITDPANTLISIVIRYNKTSKLFETNHGTLTINAEDITDETFTLNVTYNLSSVPSGNKVEKIEFTEKQAEPEQPDEPIQPEQPTEQKKKCGKKSSELIISILSLMTMLVVLLKKKQ